MLLGKYLDTVLGLALLSAPHPALSPQGKTVGVAHTTMASAVIYSSSPLNFASTE
jgi:hypothetical protein